MTVLVIAAHPDDEVLGCGGTMARHVAEGETVHVLIMAEGATSRDENRDVDERKDEISLLREAANSAAAVLGTQMPEFCGFPDNRMDQLDLLDVVKKIEDAISTIQPTIVYTHHGGDLNVDHQIVHQATVTACRPLPGSSVKELYTYEVASSTEWGGGTKLDVFVPQHFVEIEGYLETKKSALEIYKSEMRDFPHARSIEAVKALARVRGSHVGVKAAEAFMLMRKIR